MTNKNAFATIAAAAGAVAVVPLSYEVAGTANTTSNTTSPTFSSVSLGSLPSSGFKRYIAIVEGGNTGSGGELNNIFVDGVGAGRIVGLSAPTGTFKQLASIYLLEKSTGTTATIYVNTAGTAKAVGLQLYSIYVPEEAVLTAYATDTDSASTSLSLSLNTPAGDSVMLAVAAFRNGEATPSLSFGGTAGLTTDFRVDSSGTNENQYIGSKEFLSANSGLTVTATDATADGAESVMCGAVFKAEIPDFTAEYLVVGGGGGGGASLGDFTTATGGGGGGGGGAVLSGSFGGKSGVTYTITVGAGGAGGGSGTITRSGSKGEESSISGVVTAEGGGAGGGDDQSGGNGGCGGGAGGTSTSGTGGVGTTGFDGGDSLSGTNNNGAGGGGMGAAGQDGGTTAGNYGDGGNGIASSITGTSVYYGGGGGGGEGADAINDQGDGGLGGGGRGGTVNRVPQDPVAGTANTGGGGGGGADDTGTEKDGADGGSGVVILRSLETAASTTGSPTVTTDGSYVIYTFTSSGSITY